MGLIGRIGVVLTNSLVIMPVFVLLLVAAIMSSVGAAKLEKLSDASEAHKMVTMTTVALWVLFAGGLGFMFTIGLFIIPTVVTIPYLFGGALGIFGLVNLALASVLFYGANAARTSAEYKDSTSSNHSNAKSAFNSLLICGLMMTFAALFMFGYAAFTIYKYHKGGGVLGDVALVGNYGGDIALAVPGAEEFAPVLKGVGAVAQHNLNKEQQAELEKRGAQLGQAQALAGHASQAFGKGGGGFGSFLKNPEVMQAAKGLLTTAEVVA